MFGGDIFFSSDEDEGYQVSDPESADERHAEFEEFQEAPGTQKDHGSVLYGLANASAAERENRQFVLNCLLKDGLQLAFAAEPLRGDYGLVSTAVRQNGLALEHASAAFRDHEDIVMQALSRNGLALEFASERLRDDSIVIQIALAQNLQAIRHVSPRQKQGNAFYRISEGPRRRPQNDRTRKGPPSRGVLFCRTGKRRRNRLGRRGLRPVRGPQGRESALKCLRATARRRGNRDRRGAEPGTQSPLRLRGPLGPFRRRPQSREAKRPRPRILFRKHLRQLFNLCSGGEAKRRGFKVGLLPPEIQPGPRASGGAAGRRSAGRGGRARAGQKGHCAGCREAEWRQSPLRLDEAELRQRSGHQGGDPGRGGALVCELEVEEP